MIAVFIILFCAFYAIHKKQSEKRQRRKEAEQRRREAEQRERDRALRQELREIAQRQAAEMKAREAIRKEQERLAREQERERKEREAADAKLAKEQEKLAKRVAVLESKVRKLDRDIESQKQLMADYNAQLDNLLLKQSVTIPGSDAFTKLQDKIVTKSNQARKAENKYFDMMEAKAMAEKELSAA